MLDKKEIARWLDGIVPAWSLLTPESFNSLQRRPSTVRTAIRLAADLSMDEVSTSAMARNALIVLKAAAKPPGLKLTSTGNLSRHVVAAMFERLDWPGLERDVILQLHKVINEPDFLPLYFVRNLLEASRLVRTHKGHLVITPAGRNVLDGASLPTLQAVLFETAFWKIDLGCFSRGFLGNWPQDHIGIVLWCLSVSAEQWIEPHKLVRLCTLPVEGILRRPYDIPQYALEGAILRPLEAFGLVERREDPIPGERFGSKTFYRKSLFFDRFLTFNVKLSTDGAIRH